MKKRSISSYSTLSFATKWHLIHNLCLIHQYLHPLVRNSQEISRLGNTITEFQDHSWKSDLKYLINFNSFVNLLCYLILHGGRNNKPNVNENCEYFNGNASYIPRRNQTANSTSRHRLFKGSIRLQSTTYSLYLSCQL